MKRISIGSHRTSMIRGDLNMHEYSFRFSKSFIAVSFFVLLLSFSTTASAASCVSKLMVQQYHYTNTADQVEILQIYHLLKEDCGSYIILAYNSDRISDARAYGHDLSTFEVNQSGAYYAGEMSVRDRRGITRGGYPFEMKLDMIASTISIKLTSPKGRLLADRTLPLHNSPWPIMFSP